MLNGNEAIKILADAMGVTPVTVGLHSRALREHEPALWVRAGSGRRNIGPNVSHLSNLLIAAATDFPAVAVANVLRYRALICDDGIEFGQYLDGFVDLLARDVDGSIHARFGENKSFVDLVLGITPRATIRLREDGNTGFNLVFLPAQRDLLLKQTEDHGYKTRLIPRVTITLELLDVLARLWRETIAYSAGKSASSLADEVPVDAKAAMKNVGLFGRKPALFSQLRDN